MKKLFLLITGIFFFLLSFNLVKAQNVLDGVYVKEHVDSRKPIAYNYLREADVMWSKKIWRMLDLREKQNFPLYFPTKQVDYRYSLIDLILAAAEKGYDLNEKEADAHLVLYVAAPNDKVVISEFLNPINPNGLADTAKLKQELYLKFDVKDEKKAIENVVTGVWDTTIIHGEMHTSEVLRYIMKEEWYFDKQRAKMEVRIIGLCPIRVYKDKAVSNATTNTGGNEEEDEQLGMKLLFWVYFPALRPVLANHEVFNVNNDAERRTFDDIFYKRKFSSFIIQETNVYDNRQIAEYRYGLDAQLEAEKIKDFMFKIEHDLWEF